MSNSTLALAPTAVETTSVWDSLKTVIAQSSGFKRWRQETIRQPLELDAADLDIQVAAYLRQTLETLAY